MLKVLGNQENREYFKKRGKIYISSIKMILFLGFKVRNKVQKN